MKGYIINRTGTFKHVFKRTFAPNTKVDMNDLYRDWGFNLTTDDFVTKIKSILNVMDGMDLEDFKLDVKDVRTLEDSQEVNIVISNPKDVDVAEVTPAYIANNKYTASMGQLIKNIENLKTLKYALTLVNKKKSPNRWLQKALSTRINQLTSKN